jgi:hypothetical protein
MRTEQTTRSGPKLRGEGHEQVPFLKRVLIITEASARTMIWNGKSGEELYLQSYLRKPVDQLWTKVFSTSSTAFSGELLLGNSMYVRTRLEPVYYDTQMQIGLYARLSS